MGPKTTLSECLVSIRQHCIAPCVSIETLKTLSATTIIHVRPLTGRSHQIRAHLAHTGHPIANDAPYGGPYPGPIVFGPRPQGDAPTPPAPVEPPTGMFAIPHDGAVDEHCAYCPWLVPHDWPIDLVPLWLHAILYAGPTWRFACEAPGWAAAGGVGQLDEGSKGVKRWRPSNAEAIDE